MSESDEKKLSTKYFAIDTETTGLRPYQGDKAFAVSVWDEHGGVYYDQRLENWSKVVDRLKWIGSDPTHVLFMANAKFDLAFLHLLGGPLPRGRIHDVLTHARILDNSHLSYSLDSVSRRAFGVGKDTSVDAYMKEHRLKSFADVPMEIMRTYAIKDVELTYKVGLLQLSELRALHDNQVNLQRPGVWPLYENECELTKTLFNMELGGVKIDQAYIQRGIEYEEQRCVDLRREFKTITGEEFLDSNKNLTRLFNGRPRLSGQSRKTEKGNPSWDDVSLAGMGELGELIVKHRTAQKRRSAFFENYRGFADSLGYLHPNYKQGGTATGRLSCGEPNLQQIPKEEEEGLSVKGAFAVEAGSCLVELDYKAVEFRMLLNYAKERELIAAIQAGLDPHQATAEMVGITRQQAKTLNFAILYGAGPSKISVMLGCTDAEAKKLKRRYFLRLPKVEQLIYKTTHMAETRGFIFNWLGRIYRFDRKFAYKATNYLIQGGCSEVIKIAMNRIGGYLADKQTKMLLSIHDAILFSVPKEELTIVRELQKIMEDVYPGELKLECDVKYSWTNWAEMKGGYPNGTEARDGIQKQGDQVAQFAALYHGLLHSTAST